MTDHNPILPEDARIVRIKDTEYVAIHKYWWDKEKKRGQQKRRYIGKLVDGKFVPNAAYAAELKLTRVKKTTDKRQKFDHDKTFGTTALLTQAAETSGLTDDLKKVYGEGKAAMMVSLAAYQIIKNTTSQHRFKIFSDTNALPAGLPDNIESQRLSELSQDIGSDTASLNRLFALRAKRLPETEYLSFDSTRIASESRSLTDVRKGISKRGGYENQIGLALLYGHNSGVPLMFRRFAGNVPDIVTMHDLLTRWENIGVSKKIISIFDRGYCSRENLRLLCKNKHHFIMAAKTDHSFIRDAIEDNLPAFWDMTNNVRGHNLTAVQTQVTIPGTKEDPKSCSVWVYIYYSLAVANNEQDKFLSDLVTFEEDWINGLASPDSKLLRFYETPDSEPGKKPLIRNNDAVNEKVRYMGFFSMISDRKLESKEILEIYRTRDSIEKCFGVIKTDVGFTTTRGHSDVSVNGRLLLAFIAATIVSWLIKAMSVEVKIGKKSYAPLLDEYSLMELLEDVGQIRFYSSSTGKVWLGEILGRHRLVFERLGLENCLLNPAMYK